MTVPPPQPAGYWTPKTVPPFGGVPGRAPVNYWAWTGLLVSISGFLFPIGVNGVLGVIFSIFGLREARKLAEAGHPETGSPLARAGVIVGVVHIVLTAAVVVASVLAFIWFTEWVADLPTQFQVTNY